MPLSLIAIFIIVPILELYVIIKIGGSIGTVPTLLLLIVDSIIGTLLLRSQGRSAWVSFNRALAESRVPAKEIMDGVLIIFGGALLLTPGFLTDIVGLFLLIPPTRAIVRGFAGRLAVGRFALGARGASWGYERVQGRRHGPPAPGDPAQEAPAQGRRSGQPRPEAEDFDWTTPAPRPADIEGTAEEVRDEDSLPPGERGSFQG